MTTKCTKTISQHWNFRVHAALALFFLCFFLPVANAKDSFLPSEWKEKNDLLLQPAESSGTPSAGLFLDIHSFGTRLVAVGERGHIIYSDDSGRSWDQADVPVQVTLTAIHFPTVQHGWAVGHDGVILHTRDGGESWIKQMDGREGGRLNMEHAQKLLERKEAELARAKAGRQDELQKTIEDLNWELSYWEQENEMWGHPLLDVWFKNHREGFAIGAYGRFFETRDGGETWLPAWDRIENPNKWHLNAISASRDTVFIAGEAGMLYRSRDGKHWETLESPYDGSYLGIIASPENEFVLAYGIGARVALSKDLGKTWELFQTDAGAALSGGTIQSDGSVLLVSYSGTILKGPGTSSSFTAERIRGTWNAVIETGDNHIILAGRKGIHRTPF